MQILLVEPDRLLARTFVSALEAAGHQVAHAVSAQSAVHMADEISPNIVILELQLPLHNGVEFLYEFRSYPEWFTIPIVIHSFIPPNELASAATLQQELGVTKILYKPATTLKQLVAAVSTLAPQKA